MKVCKMMLHSYIRTDRDRGRTICSKVVANRRLAPQRRTCLFCWNL